MKAKKKYLKVDQEIDFNNWAIEKLYIKSGLRKDYTFKNQVTYCPSLIFKDSSVSLILIIFLSVSLGKLIFLNTFKLQ